jgi:hypothetical protein
MQIKKIASRFFSSVFGLSLVLLSCGAPPEKACSEDRQCAKGEICLQERCLKGCRQHTDCGEKQYCRDLQCNAQLCTPGQTRECYDGDEKLVGKGLCKKGKQWCDALGTSWGACVEQHLPQDEICDELDNNCDGQVDEGLQCQCEKGERRRCYTGPVGTQGTGLCTLGVQYCEENNHWGACHDQGLPRRELCDGLDNDCNGAVDDGIDCTCEPGAQRECYSGPEATKGVGACKTGKQTCRPDRKWGSCDGQVLPRAEESVEDINAVRGACNGLDDNCDGSVDNRGGKPNDPMVRTCYDASPASLRKGDCKEGVQRCEAGVWSACDGQIAPKTEECNGKDDDCNGLVDDAIPTRPCLSTANTGCKQGSTGDIQCFGNCRSGRSTCLNGKWSDCQGEILPLAQELCGNKQDDDCNGQIDDGCVCKDGETRACYTGTKETRKRGECKDGLQRCVQSRWEECSDDTPPQTEVCDGKDNDCDGIVDNLTNADCKVPNQTGICSQGKLVCENNQPRCKAPTSAQEVCDGLDNNCDGEIDNLADIGKPCTDAAALGPCKDGVWRCENNQKVCKSAIQPAPEICNGVDDDCDGKIDNPAGSCVVSGKLGICAVGAWACEQGVKLCKQVEIGTSEVCNGVDDDCNGKIDDTVDEGKPCTDPTKKGVCAEGVFRCQKDATGAWGRVCFSQKTPQTKVCNGLDDDCDGVVDAGCVACKSHMDCGGVGLCVNGFCDKTAQCAAANDCPTDQVCKQGRCSYCALNGADCPTGQLCLADAQKGYNRCQPVQCSVNSNCSFGLVCKQNRCQNCDPAAKDAQGNPLNECGGQSACLQGKCYAPCTVDLDCGSALTQRCAAMPDRASVSSSLCLPRCTQDSDCPQGFGCFAQACVVSAVLSDGAYTFSDLSLPESCTAYRHPESGYQPQTRSGLYWIKPPNAPKKYKVYCDQAHDEGGFQLMARYTTRLNLKDFQTDKYQIQNTQTGKTLDLTQDELPNLSDLTVYGHLAYTDFVPEGREIRVICRGTSATEAVSVDLTDYTVFQNWAEGNKGTYGTGLWGFVAKGGGASRTVTEMCGTTVASTGGTFGGIAFCTGNADTLAAHRVSWRFDQTTGKPTFVCDGKQLTDGTIEVWGRAWGRNPLFVNTSGARQWKNGSVARTCREYRFSEGGQYTGTTGSGAYMIQPSPNNPPFRAYCDMGFDANGKKGGWTLFARYMIIRPVVEFDPFVHFEQTASGVLTERQSPPDLNDPTLFGHFHYGWLPLDHREFRVRTDGRDMECDEARSSGITTWKHGKTALSSGFLKLYSYKQPSLTGWSNGTGGGVCRDEEKYIHSTMLGFLYCGGGASPLFGVAKGSQENNVCGFCRGQAKCFPGEIRLYLR